MLTIEKNKYSELQLVDAIKGKKEAAFDYLYDQYAPALYSYIRKTLLEKSISEETLQQVLSYIWKHINDYNASKERLFTWMVNIACKEARKRKVEIVLKQLFSCQHVNSTPKIYTAVTAN